VEDLEMREGQMDSILIQAINLYHSISIKKIHTALSGKVIDSTLNELQLQYGMNSYLFIYRFGALVAFNLSDDILVAERRKLMALIGPELEKPTSETYHVVIQGQQDNVEFEYVQLKKLSLSNLRLIAITLGQSAALEFVEIEANRLLSETMELMERLGRQGSVPLGSKSLLKFVGSAAANRQHIISSLAIFDPPDETWTSVESQRLFADLQQNFDIDVRFKDLDRKLSLVQDNIEILVDLSTSRRSALLEIMIVLLIILEVILAIWQVH
jgi:uncharacterized Rmd1/YagE family protein